MSREVHRALGLLIGARRGTKLTKAQRAQQRTVRSAARRWYDDPNVVGVGVGTRVTGGRDTGAPALRVHVLKKLPLRRLNGRAIPPIIHLPGRKQPVEVDVVEGGIGRAQRALLGDGVALAGTDAFGTLGCVVRRAGSPDRFALTCAHVLDGTPQAGVEWAEFPPQPAPPNPTIGTLAYKTRFITGDGFPNVTDAALVRLLPDAVSPIVRWLGDIAGVRTTPMRQGEVVRLCGYGTSRSAVDARGTCSGEVIEPSSAQTIQVEGWGELGFRNLVLCTRFTRAMDSGAAVLDGDDRLVGIHMAATDPGSDTPWSAFQPIASVFQSFSLTLDTAVATKAASAVALHAAGGTQGRPMPKVGDRATAIDTLARTLWGEARGETDAGRAGVANVILNRVAEHKPARFGATVEAVCRKPWQFSCWNSGDPNLPKLKAVTDANADFRGCLELARTAVNGDLRDNTRGSDHYHTLNVMPTWAIGRTPAVTIGHHHFYNTIP